MSFRFWRRIRIAPGVTLNLSKSGGSLSFGPRGAKFTIGPRGKRATVGIPGTGLFYTTTRPSGKSSPEPSARAVPKISKRYFEKNIDTFPNSLRVLRSEKWTPTELKENHQTVLKNLGEHYGINVDVISTVKDVNTDGSEVPNTK